MGRGDHCAVYGCSNDRRYPEKQVVLPHVGILRFYSPLNRKDVGKWERLLNRRDFKVTLSTMVCSSHFAGGYRSKECPNPTLHLKGYDRVEKGKRRSSPTKRDRYLSPKPKKRRRNNEVYQGPESNDVLVKDDDVETNDNGQSSAASVKPSLSKSTNCSPTPNMSDDGIPLVDGKTQRGNLFMIQPTCPKNCSRYTGLSRPKLDLVFDLIREKAAGLRYWRGSVDTPPSRREKRKAQPRYLSPWVELILTLVRTRKGFDVHFLADTFGISGGQVSRIYNTWITFLSCELSFLVPWPSRAEIQKVLPKRFRNFNNVRAIIDCCEFYVQKPVIPKSQKTTWSNYKHNTVKLLVGITPTGVISFIPPLWTGSTSDKEMVRNSVLIDCLEGHGGKRG